jgi:hypothetical protein
MEYERDVPESWRNAQHYENEEEEMEGEMEDDEDEDEGEAPREMQVYDIRGVAVGFPYTAYDSQRVYMEKVIQSLQEVPEPCTVLRFLSTRWY